MSTLKNFKTMMSVPQLAKAYFRWIGSTLVFGRRPGIQIASDIYIREWLSFSEFWSFQGGIPSQERKFVERCLSGVADQSLTSFDIGANIGVFSCFMAGLGAKVHAFEPIPKTFCRLKENVQSNELLDRVQLNCLAVGREQGLVKFHIEERDAATNRMVAPGQHFGKAATSTQLVATISLDEYCRENGIQQIDFLKIDVEGMEPYVLEGARALLTERRIKALLIEICPVNLLSVGASALDLYRQFDVVGYSPYALTMEGALGDRLSLEAIETTKLANVALLPDA